MLIDHVDRWINWLKWPVAVTSVLSLPLAMWGMWSMLKLVPLHPWNALTFTAGVVLFVILWRSYLAGTSAGRWLVRTEHELTHLIFAMLTGHRILSFRTREMDSQVRFRGQGNWLITSAPYFFPTSALILFLLSLLMPIPLLPWTNVFLGMATGFHVVSGYYELHRDQEDLKALGWLFCWCFLPTANLVCLALLLAVALHGVRGVLELGSAWLAIPQWFIAAVSS